MRSKSKQPGAPEPTPTPGPPVPISELHKHHLTLMQAYYDVLRDLASRENDPNPAGDVSGNASTMRRYAHAHIRRQLRDLSSAYLARVTLIPPGAGDDRDWLGDVREDVEKLADSLKAWDFRLGRRSVTALGVVGSIAGILRGVKIDAGGEVLEALLGLVIGAAFGMATSLVWVVLLLRGAFLAKRQLYLEAGIYAKEQALFGALGMRKRLEPLTDYSLLEVLSVLVGVLLGVFLAVSEATSGVGAVMIGGGVALVPMYVIMALEYLRGRKRSPR